MKTVQPKELRKIVAKNIRTRRLELHKGQTEVAKDTGVTQAYISQLENAVRAADTDILAALADALQTTPSALLSPEIFSPAIAR